MVYTKNVIYLISCRKCAVQYVGETSQTLRCRFNESTEVQTLGVIRIQLYIVSIF